MNIWSYKFSNYHLGINITKEERGRERVSRGEGRGERGEGDVQSQYFFDNRKDIAMTVVLGFVFRAAALVLLYVLDRHKKK